MINRQTQFRTLINYLNENPEQHDIRLGDMVVALRVRGFNISLLSVYLHPLIKKSYIKRSRRAVYQRVKEIPTKLPLHDPEYFKKYFGY